MIMSVINTISGFLWGWPLITLLIAGGIYFSVRTHFVQFGMFKEAWRVILEKPENEGDISSFGALMVSTASRVGTGNIIGVSTAICLGGPGALFWMWVVALLGGASGFVESCLAQIYKKKNPDGSSYGGPAYYIEAALHSRPLAIIFSVCLIACYGIAFNMLAAYNMQSTFKYYSFYDPAVFPKVFGAALGLLCLYCLIGGGRRIVAICERLVPVMGVFYVLVAIVVIILNIGNIPHMLGMIFADAFDFKAIFSGLMGSCMILGFKRGLFSNEAGIGSAPNAAASASTSHPAKQGLVQMMSVFIDTLLLCSCTGFMCLCSGVAPTKELSGAPYVQESLKAVFGEIGPTFMVVALAMFAFSTLLGNFFFIENCFTYLNGKPLSKSALNTIRTVGAVIIGIGATLSAGTVWDLADFLNVIMAFINMPVCMLIGGTAYKCLNDYREKRKTSDKIHFHAKDIGLDPSTLDFWNE